jgi:hypothetical protein
MSSRRWPVDRQVGAGAHVPERIESILLIEPNIEDHQIHIGISELTRHFLAAFRRQDLDVIVFKVVYDHAP